MEGNSVNSRTQHFLVLKAGVSPLSGCILSSRFTSHVNLDKNLIFVGLGFLKGTLRSLSLRDASL